MKPSRRRSKKRPTRLAELATAAKLVEHEGWFLHPEVVADHDLFRQHDPPRPMSLLRQIRSEATSWSGLVWLAAGALLGYGLTTSELFSTVIGAVGVAGMAYLMVGVWRTQRHGRLVVGRAVSRLGDPTVGATSYAKYQVLLPEGEAWWSLELALPSRPADHLISTDGECEVLFMVHRTPRSAYPFGIRPKTKTAGH